MKESRWDKFWDKAGDILQIPIATILIYNAILIAIETGGCPSTNLEGLLWTYGNFFLGVRLLIKGFTLTSKQEK